MESWNLLFVMLLLNLISLNHVHWTMLVLAKRYYQRRRLICELVGFSSPQTKGKIKKEENAESSGSDQAEPILTQYYML